MKLSDADLDVVFALGDLDGDGEISLGEFIRVMSPLTATALARFRNTFNVIEDVVSAFRIIDSNNDGALSKSELEAGMNSFGKKFSQVEIDSVFALADVNSDGEINYSEFVSVMFPAAASAVASPTLARALRWVAGAGKGCRFYRGFVGRQPLSALGWCGGSNQGHAPGAVFTETSFRWTTLFAATQGAICLAHFSQQRWRCGRPPHRRNS